MNTGRPDKVYHTLPTNHSKRTVIVATIFVFLFLFIFIVVLFTITIVCNLSYVASNDGCYLLAACRCFNWFIYCVVCGMANKILSLSLSLSSCEQYGQRSEFRTPFKSTNCVPIIMHLLHETWPSPTGQQEAKLFVAKTADRTAPRTADCLCHN